MILWILFRLLKLAVFILRTNYSSGRTLANIRSSSGYASQVRIMRLDELSFEIRLERLDALGKVVHLDA